MATQFWDTLIHRVQSGEMDMEEAHLRDNYYRFARHMPGIVAPEEYVLDALREALPPMVFANGDEVKFERYVQRVKEGMMCAYEAAEAYYEAVME